MWLLSAAAGPSAGSQTTPLLTGLPCSHSQRPQPITSLGEAPTGLWDPPPAPILNRNPSFATIVGKENQLRRVPLGYVKFISPMQDYLIRFPPANTFLLLCYAVFLHSFINFIFQRVIPACHSVSASSKRSSAGISTEKTHTRAQTCS